uniref:Uncharacterized protein n=1 Tax=Arundo donax TaxID=35708 RepID=A0A0A9B483_ARUDO
MIPALTKVNRRMEKTPSRSTIKQSLEMSGEISEKYQSSTSQ